MKDNIFTKVTKEEFIDSYRRYFPDDSKNMASSAYDELIMPSSASLESPFSCFHIPRQIALQPGDSITVPTGMRCTLDASSVLLCVPDKSLAKDYRLQFDSTMQILTYLDKNEIIFKLTNDSLEGRDLVIKKGESFCQAYLLKSC